MKIVFSDLGTMEYKEAWEIQHHVHEQLTRVKTAGDAPADNGPLPHLFFVEHPHVYTLGKSGHENNLLINPQFLASIGAGYFKTDRGGDITYHGPGQIVGYPIFDLDLLGMGVKKYIFTLEEVMIQTLYTFGIEASRAEGATGVWMDVHNPAEARKICAIGVRISHGVTMHGFALNVNTNLKYFSHINPCGFTDKGVTSMQQELGSALDPEEVKKQLLIGFSRLFKVDWQ